MDLCGGALAHDEEVLASHLAIWLTLTQAFDLSLRAWNPEYARRGDAVLLPDRTTLVL
jgi:hypothetical protein